jgi:hypothetical protein
MYTGIFGAGLIWFVGRPDVPARKGLGIGLMASAMLMHGLWDASAAIGGNTAFGLVVPIVIAGAVITIFVWVYNTSVQIEREWMRELLAPEVELGVVTQPELDALAGSRSTLRKYVRAQHEPRTAKRVTDAETQLARQIARDDGAETAAVRSAREAVSRARDNGSRS